MESSSSAKRIANNENIAANSVKQHKRSVQYEDNVATEPLTKTTNCCNRNEFEPNHSQDISWKSALPQVKIEMKFLGSGSRSRFFHCTPYSSRSDSSIMCDLFDCHSGWHQYVVFGDFAATVGRSGQSHTN